nr:CPBP family intramembrane metalloprotease [Neobacillus sp. 114]
MTTFIYPFPEEVLFRGFILQKMAKSLKFLKANQYCSLLFVLIHFPA